MNLILSLLWLIILSTTAMAGSPFLSRLRCAMNRVKRVIAIGDLHANLDNTRRTLIMAQVIDEQGRWVAPAGTWVVQLGDVVDLGTDTLPVLALMEQLGMEAKRHRCWFSVLVGNHEYQNMRNRNHNDLIPEEIQKNYPCGPDERWELFSHGGPIYQQLSRFPIALRIRDSVFVHAGFTPDTAKLGIRFYNSLWRHVMRSKQPTPKESMYFGKKAQFGSPIWTRTYKKMETEEERLEKCRMVQETVRLLGVKRMVIGHLSTRDGRIRVECDGQLIFMDTKIHEGKLSAMIIEYSTFDINVMPTLTAIYEDGPQVISGSTDLTLSSNDGDDE